MNLTDRPIFQKGQKPAPVKAIGKDPAYLARVRELPCVICIEWGMRQNSPTESHHTKSGRYGNLRTPDRMAIPLCHSHHNKLRKYPGDEDKIGFHNAQATWERLYGLDTDWRAQTQDKILGKERT